MSVRLTSELADFVNDKSTTKILATVNGDGSPHAVVKHSLHVGDDGNIHVLELLESSNTNRNLVRSIWFGSKVAIALLGKDGRSIQIKGQPVKNHITGPLFQAHYQRIREQLGDVDLSSVWVIEPHEVIDQSFAKRKAEEEAKHPFFTHLDRLAG
ncbi:MAG: pyridoxamine 5'-phosphate oxidase family protein [Rhodospirillales bacterium]|nr:MAG: pyridoxamine 5'-phosphate oxidase family protein [Rhodospirillales bacterium]